MRKQILIKIDSTEYETWKAYANQEKRTLQSLIRYAMDKLLCSVKRRSGGKT